MMSSFSQHHKGYNVRKVSAEVAITYVDKGGVNEMLSTVFL